MAIIIPHTTRAAGTVLTASIYNADHVNHVTNANSLNTAKLESPIGTSQISDDSITNSKLANMVAQAIKMRNNAAAGDPQDQIHSDVTTATPVSGDLALGWTAAGLLRKFDVVNFGGATVPRRVIIGADTVGIGDKGGIIEITSGGPFTLAFTAAATLANNFTVMLLNSSDTDITLDPNGAELIDGLTSWVLYPGGAVFVHGNGTAFESLMLNGMRKQFDASGTWTKPGVGKYIIVECWGGGGSGARAQNGEGGGGGGGGAYNRRWLPFSALGATETVTVGTGGASRTVDNTDGAPGGNTTFGAHITGFEGGGGGDQAGGNGGGGGGGGVSGAGATATTDVGANGGFPRYWVPVAATNRFGTGGTADAPGEDNPTGGGGGGGGETAVQARKGGDAFWGGGGGGGAAGSVATQGTGGLSVYGGAGGGGGAATTAAAAGGTSQFGGNGGAGATGGANGVAGSAPGGGGGGSENSNSGAGGAGRCIVYMW